MASARYVWELSRAALAGRDGDAVVIKVYMDESGTHEGSPVVSVGAYFAKPRTWEAFTREWNARKRPIKVFHAADCAALKNEFEGWTAADRDAYVAQLLPVLPRHTIGGLAICINMNDFRAALADRPDLTETLFGSPYATCFQWAVQRIVDILDSNEGHQRIAFFHEQNDYQQQALEAFEYVRAHRVRHQGKMTLTFAGKDDFVPLQAADVLAYEANKLGRDIRKPVKRRALTALDPDKTRISIQGYSKENMPWLVSRLSILAEEVKTFGKPVTFLPPERRS